MTLPERSTEAANRETGRAVSSSITVIQTPPIMSLMRLNMTARDGRRRGRSQRQDEPDEPELAEQEVPVELPEVPAKFVLAKLSILSTVPEPRATVHTITAAIIEHQPQAQEQQQRQLEHRPRVDVADQPPDPPGLELLAPSPRRSRWVDRLRAGRRSHRRRPGAVGPRRDLGGASPGAPPVLSG